MASYSSLCCFPLVLLCGFSCIEICAPKRTCNYAANVVFGQ